jgi:hypothetical protein
MDRVADTKTERLQAAGISPRQAKQWEKLAAVPQADFDFLLADRMRSRPRTESFAPPSG